MKAVGFSNVGGPEVLRTLDIDDPVAGPDEVIIQTKAIGVNFADIYRRRGEYPSEPPCPFVLGHEGAGVISAVGENIKNLKVGDRVAFAHVPRSNAEFVKAPGWKVIPLPSDISFDVAASVLLQGLTAHYLTHDSTQIKKDDVVLIHSASGGVGQLLTQICKNLGAVTIGTVSGPSKTAAAQSAGADFVISRNANDWTEQVLEITKNRGVDKSFDGIGSTLEKTISTVRTGGTAVYFGWSGGSPPHIDPQILMNESKALVGGELWSHISTHEDLLRRSEFLFSLIRSRELRPQISKKYSLFDVAKAHRALESGQTTGKIILQV